LSRDYLDQESADFGFIRMIDHPFTDSVPVSFRQLMLACKGPHKKRHYADVSRRRTDFIHRTSPGVTSLYVPE